MKCFGDKNRTHHSKVVLLDEQELIQEIQDTTTGQDLLETVFNHLNLVETAYFGLRYLDPSNQTHWLDPTKKVVKQLKGTSPFTLYFSVKFYAADPCKLVEEITRYQFFLQVKQDILQGRLPISQELAAELGSYAVQSELGDYDPRRHSPGYVSEFRFVTTQTVALENKIAELHKKLIGQVPSKAEMCYLEKVKWLDMYGVDLHPVLGEDNIEYFLGLTPSGVIVLRNKAKVGNYYWPRISKVYFRGRFFMLRVRDKNNSENTYGFETPSKAACKHLWQCCVEHHAFFRLTQASGNSPAAIFSLGSKFRYSGRTEKEAVQDAKIGSRTQPEFTRMPSRRYQRRIVEGAQDKAFRCWIITKAPRVEDVEVKPETRNTVQLPTPVSTVSHMYRSTSMTLAPRSDSPRSTRSAPYPASVATSGGTATLLGGRSGEHRPRGESPRSVHSAVSAPQNCVVSRRTSSVDSQSSVDSRGHRRHRRSRGRSSDGESEASSKCSSRGHRRHRHRHHSDDSDHHRHRHRRRRHKSGGSMVNSDAQWAQVQAGEVQVRGNTATVRDLSHKSGYQPSGIDTEADSHHQHSNKKRHRKHRSRSRSPSEAKNTRLPDELRRHLEFDLQKTQGLTEAELKEIPYTKVETAKTIKIKYTSPKTKRHKSPRRSKSNSSDRKATPPADGESPPPPYTPSPTSKTNTLPKASHKSQDTSGEGTSARAPDGGGMVNGTLRPPGPRAVQAPTVAISRVKSSEGLSSLANCSRGSNGDSPGAFRSHNDSGNNIGVMKTSASASTSTSCSSYGFTSSTSHKPVMINSPSVKALVTNSANRASPTLCREASNPDSSAFLEETSGFVAANGFVPTSAAILKNGTNERGSHFTAVLKPQPSPQSSVTSGISVGSSSVSISADSTLTSGSQNNFNKDISHNHNHQLSSASNSPDLDDLKGHDYHSYENFSFDHNSYDNSTTCDSPEPYYSNCSSHCDQLKSGQSKSNSLYPSLEPITQHSTNILIHYHDLDTLTSTSQLPINQPIPRPRSSIISSVHSNDSSTHIVQSYGPTIRDSENDTNSLQRSGYTSPPLKLGSNFGHNSVGLPISSSMSSSPAPSGSPVTGCGSSTLPRPSNSRQPLMRTTGSQTNTLRTTASQTNNSNPGQRASSKPQSSKKATEMSQGIQTTNGTNLAHSALHWKVYNWDAYREETEWSNSLGRNIKGHGPEGNQASTAVVSDANGYPNGSFDCGNTAVPVKFSGLGKTNGSIGGSCMNGNNNSKTCLSLNGHSPKSKVLAPTCDEYIHINSKINSNIKSHLNSFNNGDLNGYETDYINGSLHERVTSPNGGKGIGHMKTFGNGHVSGFFNSHAKDFPNGSMNNSFEIESKNNKNVTFRFDNSLIRNSKGSGINVTVNGKLEDDHLKVKANDEYKGDLKGKLNSEVVDEISTEL
ncbi:uncharacterized protein [Panulirus ornatus]|uniref:uncharacterized protein isoform X3 n=1 Tax=Panulirus ornatus TaxID=150431 RepID=UPI003A868C01